MKCIRSLVTDDYNLFALARNASISNVHGPYCLLDGLDLAIPTDETHDVLNTYDRASRWREEIKRVELLVRCGISLPCENAKYN